MNNASIIKFKKFLGNRNTVAIICAILGVLVLFIGYNMKLNNAIEPVELPYAKKTIQPRTKIEADDIGVLEVPAAALEKMVKEDIWETKEQVEGKYTAINTLVPKGSLFYKEAVIKKSELPNAAVYEIPEGEVLDYITVNMSSSYVNSIVPGGYIDIYIRTVDKTENKVKVGKFIKDIKVLAVKTSDGLNVFENSEEARVPAYVLFSVPADQFIYLMQAEQIGLEIIPVPINFELETTEGSDETVAVVTSEDLKEYIATKAEEFLQDDIIIEDEELPFEEPPIVEE